MAKVEGVDNQLLHDRSGEVTIRHNQVLVGFLYDAMRDGYLSPGVAEKLVRENVFSLEESPPHEVVFCNGWLARYAEDLAKRLTATFYVPNLGEVKSHEEHDRY